MSCYVLEGVSFRIHEVALSYRTVGGKSEHMDNVSNVKSA